MLKLAATLLLLVVIVIVAVVICAYFGWGYDPPTSTFEEARPQLSDEYLDSFEFYA